MELITCGSGQRLASLKAMHEPLCLPYDEALFIHDAKRNKEKKNMKTCLLCKESVLIAGMRAHVGRHILVGQSEGQESASSACGWCGGSSCNVGLEKGSKASIQNVVSDNCLYFTSLPSLAQRSPRKALIAPTCQCAALHARLRLWCGSTA